MLFRSRVERGTVTLTELADSTEIPPELVADVGDWMRAAGVDTLVVYRLRFLFHLAGYTFVGLGDLPSFLVEEEARFVTPSAIRAYALAGTPQEIATRLGECAAAGLTQVLLYSPLEHAPKIITDFAEKVFPLLAPSSIA